ncbi:hypothetical protein LOTGIDRAFT_234802 [Lottia gigantea]|uniref:DBF4-type domain-containing protein n=1 Tax=Lottia gigantea TaxID=225164 RepID=V3ZZE9_LOTGI|nr:hypothetical protein LOTGIDRAFT_234802 [Lottia gigantea]ESO88035.1 hypothetical protein LOTGIDRAFT_234802 [Lottia gigantea]
MKKDYGDIKQFSGKKSAPKGAKKKLEFKQKLPLSGKTIYLDVKDVRHRKKLDDSLKSLGAEVEKFLSKEINYVISSNTNTTLPNKTNDGNKDRPDSPSFVSTPSPFNSGQGGSPTENYKQKTQTRAQAMVKLAQSQVQITPVLQNAEKFGIKVVPLEAALKWVEKEFSKLQTTSTAFKPQVIKKKTQFKVKKLRAPLIKYEAINLHYRPIQLELDSWPHCNVDTSAGSCPFDGSTIGRAQKTESEYRDKVVASLPEQNENNSIETPQDKNPSKRNQNEEISSSKLFGMPILTAGDLKQRQKMKKKQGYCECCQMKYDSLDKHLREEEHRQFARDKNNFKHLDLIIKTVHSPAKFLQKVLHRHCVQNNEKKRDSRSTEETPLNDELKSPQKQTRSRSMTPRKSKDLEHLKENDICRRLISSRHSLSISGVKVHPSQQTTSFVDDLCTPNEKKQALISPCSVVMNTINLDDIGGKSAKTDLPPLSLIKQKKLIIRNMAIGSLQVASTSPDKIRCEKEGETIKKQCSEDSESGISKSVYFSSDYSGSDSHPSSEEVTFKPKTEKVTMPNTNLPIKNVNSKNDISSDYYESKVRSARKQLAKKSPKNRILNLNNLCKIKKHSIKKVKKKVNTSEGGHSSSQPLKQTKTILQQLDKLSASSPINKAPNTPISIFPIDMNEKCLKFSEKGGRKSRNSMEVQYHDFMIFDSLIEVTKKSKKTSTKSAAEVETNEVEANGKLKQKLTSESKSIGNIASQSKASKHVEDQNIRNPKSASVISISSKQRHNVRYSMSYSSQTITSVSSGDHVKHQSSKRHSSEIQEINKSDESQICQICSYPKHLSSQTQNTASSEDAACSSEKNRIDYCNSEHSELVRKIRRSSKSLSSQNMVSVSSEDTAKSNSVSNSSQVVRKNQKRSKPSSMFTQRIISSDSQKKETSESDRSHYVCKNRQIFRDTNTESENKDSLISQMSGITKLPDSQKNKFQGTSDTICSQDSKLFQNVIVELEPLKIMAQTNKSIFQGNCEQCHEIPINFNPSPVFKKSPALRNQDNLSVTGFQSDILPEAGSENIVSPRSEVSSTLRRRVKRQKQSYHKLSASKSTGNVSHEPLSTDFNTTRRSLHSELHEVSITPKSGSHIKSVKTTESDSNLNIFNMSNNVVDNKIKERCSSEITSVTGSKRYKLNQSWRVLSDRSVSKLLESEQDPAPFLGFEEKDTASLPISNLSYEDQSEIDLDDSYDWVIKDTASDENDFDDLVPNCSYSSPSKASDSSWLDACEDYVMSSVSKSLLSSCSSNPSTNRKKSKLSLKRGRSKSDDNHKIELTPRKLRKRHQTGNALFPLAKSDVPEFVELKVEEKSVDEDIVFNFNSPQKIKHELSVCDIKYEVFPLKSTEKRKIFKTRPPKKRKYQMKYFKNDSRASPKNSPKDLHRLRNLKNPQAQFIVVTPPKNAVKT